MISFGSMRIMKQRQERLQDRKALKGLWMARYEWAKKNMFEIDREALRVYEVKEAAVLAALTTPTDLLMAA